MYKGTPNRQMILCQTKLIKVPKVILANAFASIHFVKYSMAKRQNASCLVPVEVALLYQLPITLIR